MNASADKRARALCAGLALALLAGAAAPQDGDVRYSRRFGDYTVFYNALRVSELPDQVLSAHELPMAPDEVLLIVAVEQQGENVEADVAASATNLAEQIDEIPMRELVENEMVSYMGTTDLEYREVLDFRIEIVVAGADRPFLLEFRERFYPLRGPAGPLGEPG